MHFDFAQCKQKGFAPILIIILITLAVGGYLIYQKQIKSVPVSQPSPTPVINQSGTFVKPGEILVVIKTGVKIKDVAQLVKSYNLDYRYEWRNKKESPYNPEDVVGERPWVPGKPYVPGILIVYIPLGEENKWTKIFESNSIVEYSDPITISSP